VKNKPSFKSEQVHQRDFDWTLTQAFRHIMKIGDWPDEGALAELERAVGAAEVPYMAFEKIFEWLQGDKEGNPSFWRSSVGLKLVESEVQAWPTHACGFDPNRFEFRVPSRIVKSLYSAGSRTQRLIRQLCDEEWPDGYDHLETRHIRAKISPKLKELGHPIAERSTWLRALSRRK
jgi:hypothetical protein